MIELHLTAMCRFSDTRRGRHADESILFSWLWIDHETERVKMSFQTTFPAYVSVTCCDARRLLKVQECE